MMFFKSKDREVFMLRPLLGCLIAASAWGQTASELAAKYPPVSAYEIRPGVLLTARYSGDGQVCEMVLEARHYRSPEKVDLNSDIAPKLQKQLVDELVPASEKGEPKGRWLDRDSYMAGGVSYTKHSYENVTIEEHGHYSCKDTAVDQEKAASQAPSSMSCDGGNEVVVIRWTKRVCAGPKQNSVKPSRDHHASNAKTADQRTDVARAKSSH
jgi:hypothetical protein